PLIESGPEFLPFFQGRPALLVIPGNRPLRGAWSAAERTEMRYLRVEWIHPDPNEPATLYSQLDDEGWEVRKVEVFADGRVGFASGMEATPSTVLGEKLVPSVEEIATDRQFRPVLISREEFERIWARRRDSVRTTMSR